MNSQLTALIADIRYLEGILQKLEQFSDRGARHEAQSIRDRIKELQKGVAGPYDAEQERIYQEQQREENDREDAVTGGRG